MHLPLIGLTTRNLTEPKYDLPLIVSPKSYSQMLLQSGAIPILIPINLKAGYYQDLLSRIDGIIFTGGGDIDPSRFNGLPHEKISHVDQERDNAEISLLQQVQSLNLPFMGICRGLQVINVALGGDLYTHISDQLPGALEHAYFPPENSTDFLAHTIEIKKGSCLAQIMGTTQAQVNSLHHQGIQSLAPQVTPLAWAPDGLVEAIQVPNNPFGFAVQWHPEWLPDDNYAQALFTAFIETARQHRSSSRAYRSQTELPA
jgi:putative glutamine amidotransferase